MKPDAAGYHFGRVRVAVCTAAALALLVVCTPSIALAESVEASPVVTVEGSVASVSGTVSVSPVQLTTTTVSALASAVAQATEDPATALDAGAWAEFRVYAYSTMAVLVFWMGVIPGYLIGRL